MAETSTKVFMMEVMGRHAGWIAAAAGLAGKRADAPPHIILFPENTFDETTFLATRASHGRARRLVHRGRFRRRAKCGRQVPRRSRHARMHSATHNSAAWRPVLARWCKDKLGYKYHWAVPDYLQRSARHVA